MSGQYVDRPVRMALLHPLGAWVEALELVLQRRPDIDLALAHTSPDWVGRVVEGDVDVLVMALEDADGFRPGDVERMRRRGRELQVVVVSDSEDPELVVATFRAGARAWLHPAVSVEELVAAVHGAARGETRLTPALTTVLLEALLSGERTKEHAEDALAVLSVREREILVCLAQGMTRSEIVERFTLSPHTVRTHINHVLTKLDVHNTLSAVALARRAGLVPPLSDVDAAPSGDRAGR